MADPDEYLASTHKVTRLHVQANSCYAFRLILKRVQPNQPLIGSLGGYVEHVRTLLLF
jgi:hypothetical protein